MPREKRCWSRKFFELDWQGRRNACSWNVSSGFVRSTWDGRCAIVMVVRDTARQSDTEQLYAYEDNILHSGGIAIAIEV